MAATKSAPTGTAASASAKNANPNVEGKAADLPDFSTWTAHQIGFAPYWKPTEPGAWCFMQIEAIDIRNPNFVRFLCTALKDTECRRGPGNDDADEGPVGERVMVKKGDAFSISVYEQLKKEFQFFLYALTEGGLHVPMRLTAKKKLPTKHAEGRKVWDWELLSDPVHRPALEKFRPAFNQLMAGEAEREQLNESNA